MWCVWMSSFLKLKQEVLLVGVGERHEAYGILVCQPGIEPTPPAFEVLTARKSQ